MIFWYSACTSTKTQVDKAAALAFLREIKFCFCPGYREKQRQIPIWMLRQEWDRKVTNIMRPINFDSKSFIRTQMKCSTPKLDANAAFIKEFQTPQVCFSSNANNILSWLTTNSPDEKITVICTFLSDHYDSDTEHRPDTKLVNDECLSKQSKHGRASERLNGGRVQT